LVDQEFFSQYQKIKYSFWELYNNFIAKHQLDRYALVYIVNFQVRLQTQQQADDDFSATT
jgi:hypothetical protein